MAGVVRYKHILQAARQLPPSERKKLARALESGPSSSRVRAAFQALREGHRLGPKKRKRLSALLSKGNAGPLTDAESKELNRLVDEFEGKTLELARAVSEAQKSLRPEKGKHGSKTP